MRQQSTIAVVDDDEDVRRAVSSVLRAGHFGVVTFSSGDGFLAYGGSSAVACLLSDVHMPGMTGFALQAIVRERHPGLPVVLMTALPDDDLTRRAGAAGVRAVLRKPFGADELEDCLARALGHEPGTA